MKQRVTLKNIRDYITGNTQMILDGLGAKPDYYKEQIAYRMLKCQDCWSKRECQHCGCSLPGKWYVDKSCNRGERFPDLMNEEDWNKYKKDNNLNDK